MRLLQDTLAVLSQRPPGRVVSVQFLRVLSLVQLVHVRLQGRGERGEILFLYRFERNILRRRSRSSDGRVGANDRIARVVLGLESDARLEGELLLRSVFQLKYL